MLFRNAKAVDVEAELVSPASKLTTRIAMRLLDAKQVACVLLQQGRQLAAARSWAVFGGSCRARPRRWRLRWPANRVAACPEAPSVAPSCMRPTDILQFADVERPCIQHHRLSDWWRQFQRAARESVAQSAAHLRRWRSGGNARTMAEPSKQVCAKAAALHRVAQIAIGRGNDTHRRNALPWSNPAARIRAARSRAAAFVVQSAARRLRREIESRLPLRRNTRAADRTGECAAMDAEEQTFR